jgi:hypothetical protein
MTKRHRAILETMAGEIRIIYESDSQRAETLIETYLGQRLNEYLPDEKIAILEELSARFETIAQDYDRCDVAASEVLLPVYSLLLGEKIDVGDLSSTQINEKLALAMNTVFDTINQIIRVIHKTLLGEKAEVQTIREVIGSQIEGECGRDSLKCYLDQIQEAFLMAHRAFQEASRAQIEQVLNELDPSRISDTVRHGLKFGPLYKAELFEVYKERYRGCRAWFESNRSTQDILREFEKICQKSYETKKRGSS